jgi:2-phospho-L-lactate guanylyltransferase
MPDQEAAFDRLPLTWAVVVARAGGGTKSRLAPVLDLAERSTLVYAMLADVVDACLGTPGLAGVLVVTDTARAQSIARAAGARSLPDPGTGMNGAVEAGLAEVGRWGAEAAIVLPGDVPLVEPSDLAVLLDDVQHPCVVGATAPRPSPVVLHASSLPRLVAVATDSAGDGTNGLALRPPGVIRPSFGLSSAERHLVAGAARGAVTRRRRLPGLALDVDTPAQLAALRSHVRPGSATAQALAQLATAHAAAGPPVG